MDVGEPTEDRLVELERGLLKLAQEMGEKEWAYFVLSGRHVKIGHTKSGKSLKSRLLLYRVTAPDGGRLIGLSPGGRKTEALLHKRLADYRHRGEWFRLSRKVLATLRYEGFWPTRLMEGWPFKYTADSIQPIGRSERWTD